MKKNLKNLKKEQTLSSAAAEFRNYVQDTLDAGQQEQVPEK